MDQRRLVGRRYEDYLRNKIVIELTVEELLWRRVLCDPRYNSLIERRKSPRRKNDRQLEKPSWTMKAGGSFMFMSEF